LDELRNEPFILYPRANGSLLYDSIIGACQRAGFSPRVVQEAPQMASMVSLVAAGVGVTLVPESVCQLQPAGVRYVRINGQAPVAMLWLVAQRSATASGLDNFLRHAEKFFKLPQRRDG
jgi:DNA-binding transcriptional LysR family regulator